MNVVFWSLLLAMLLLAIAMLVIPLLRVRDSRRIAYTESNLKIYDDKVRELAQDLEEGRIDLAHYKYACNELDRELLADVPEESMDTAAQHYARTAKRQPAVALLIAVFVPLVAFLLYLQLGMHAAGTEELQAQMAEQSAPGEMSIPQMTKKLEQRIQQQGGSVTDWAMLGRAYKYMQQFDNAARAFAEALEMAPDNVELMLERAEALALLNNRKFVPEARNLILKAAAIQPDNINVMWFAGVAEFQAGNYREAIDFLGRLAKTRAMDDESVRQSVIGYMMQARDKLVAAGEEAPDIAAILAAAPAQPSASSAAQSPQSPEDVATPGVSILVQVAIDDSVKQQFKPTDDVFVYARAKQGPRMPLAVQRMKLSDFPATVTLDDSMAMVAGMNLSAFEQVVVSARVTRSGSAIAQPGDYIGSAEVNTGQPEQRVQLNIDKRVK